MTCPQCRFVSSQFAESCVECGATLRAQEKQVNSPSPLPFAPLPPELSTTQEREGASFAPPTQPSRSAPPVHAPVSHRVRSKGFQWSVPSLVLVLALSALAGRAVHSFRNQPNSAAFGDNQTDSESAESAQAREDKVIADQATLPAPTPLFTDVDPSQLRPADVRDIPLPHYVPSTHKLSLQFSQSLPSPQQTELYERYRRWLWRQTEDAPQIERLMNLYSPDAQVFVTPGKEITRDELRSIMAENRRGGFFTSVTDQKPPIWRQNAQGDQVELLAYHLYMDDAHNRLWGQRHLVWQKQGDRWLIIRDEFPPCYFNKSGQQR